MGQLYPETESPRQDNVKEKEVTCLNMSAETKLPLFAHSDYPFENQCRLNRAHLFPEKGILPHTIQND